MYVYLTEYSVMPNMITHRICRVCISLILWLAPMEHLPKFNSKTFLPSPFVKENGCRQLKLWLRPIHVMEYITCLLYWSIENIKLVKMLQIMIIESMENKSVLMPAHAFPVSGKHFGILTRISISISDLWRFKVWLKRHPCAWHVLPALTIYFVSEDYWWVNKWNKE